MTEPATTSALTMLPYQRRAIENPARFTWNCWSRQTGKSFAFSLRRILRGLQRRRNQFFLSAGERQSRELMMKARQHIEALKLAFEFHEQTHFEGTELRTLTINIPSMGIRIVGLPANPMTARGFTGDVLLDEFAMHAQDREIWASVFPTVMRGAGELDVCSTPKGRQNLFYRLKDNEQFSGETISINDAVEQGLDVDVSVLREAMEDEELYRQEFLCEFVDEATAFLTYEKIGECEDPLLPRTLDLDELAALRGDCVVGVDIGRKRDLTVIWVFELVGSTMESRGLLELASMRFREQFDILAGVLGCRCVRRCCIDSTGLGMQMAEEAADRFGSYKVEACTFSGALKSQIAGELRVRMEDRRIRIPVDEKIRNDLHSIRRSFTTAGNVRLDAPREGGSHADRFWAAALATHAAADDHGPIETATGGGSRMGGRDALVGAGVW